MIASTARLWTAEEFACRPEPPDGSKEELVRGEIVMAPPPGFEHGLIQVGISALLHAHVSRHKLGRVVVESGLITQRDPDSDRGPDVSYWSKERLPFDQTPRGFADVAADLCLEVLSPDDRPGKLRETRTEYFTRGVRQVWVIDPKTRSVSVYRSVDDRDVIDEVGHLDGGEVVPGFRCAVADIFSP